MSFFLWLCMGVITSSIMPLSKEKTFQVTVKATGINKIEGIMEFALYNNPAVFPSHDKIPESIK